MNHIISRFSWNTSFDQKEKGSELQSRLSSWSRGRMQKEISEVFDKVCPPKEIWKIQRLELDLGIIDYNNLEAEFAVSLRKQLHEKLLDLIFHAKKYKNPDIEILNEDISRLDLLCAFLISGVMPWNYRSTTGTVNEMLEHQLRYNRQNLIAILLNLGVTHENVRRRIAWQVSEASIIKIVEGLEPGSSSQIIEFSNEVAKIQARKNLVQASTVDFKKNLWFWVLNYLMKNHGSEFNKQEFLKSSIRQMADHYSITYDDLFDLIESAVEKTVQFTNAHSDFILTLKALSNERMTTDTHLPFGVNSIDPNQWDLLKNYFLDASLNRPSGQNKEFNELVICLSRQDRKAFRELICSLGDLGNKWLLVTDQLDDSSIESIMRVLDPSGWETLVQRIHFLNILCKETGLGFDRNVFWQTGISYLLSHQDTKLNSRSFMHYCAKKLESRSNLFSTGIADHLISEGIPFNLKKISFFEMHKELATVLAFRIPGSQADYYKTRLNDLIKNLSDQFAAGASGKDEFMVLQKQFIRTMQLFPETAMHALLEFRNKDQLQKIILYIVDEDTAVRLMRYTKNEKPAIISYISQMIKELKADKSTEAFAAVIGQSFFSTGLQLMILKPGLDRSAFLELLLEQLYRMIPVSMLEQFDLFVYKLFLDKKLLSYGLARSVAEKLHATYCNSSDPFVLNSMIQLIKTSPHGQARAGDLLAAHFGNNEFVQMRRFNRPESNVIVNYFLQGGAKLKQNIAERYVPIPGLSLKAVSEIELHYRLNELFWKCILDYRSYAGNEEEFGRLFQKAVVMNFKGTIAQRQDLITGKDLPGLNNNTAEVIATIEKKDTGLSPEEKNLLPAGEPAKAGDEIKLPRSKLARSMSLGMLDDLCISLIREMKVPVWFDEGATGQEVKELIDEVIHHYPVEFLIALKKEILTASQMYWLSEVLDFRVLTSSIGKLNSDRQSLLDILSAFHAVLEKMTESSIPAKQIQEILFGKVLKAWTTGNWKIIMTENILNEVFWELISKYGISKKQLILDIDKQRTYFPQPLQIAFEQLKNKNRERPGKEETATVIKPSLQEFKKQNRESLSRRGIGVKNAGLVMMNNYIMLLFERLGVTINNRYLNATVQSDAVHYLQYVVTGLNNTDESFLPLNKVLCGLPLEEPVPAGIAIPGDHIQMIEGLIKAVIGYWPSIGNTSVDGFRGNWLVRDGLLSEQEDKWELTVKKRSYDVLIARSPFSFSVIKYPWMKKPLHVNWSY